MQISDKYTQRKNGLRHVPTHLKIYAFKQCRIMLRIPQKLQASYDLLF